jgi:hypothetical protein
MPYIIRPRQMHKLAAGFIISLLIICVAPALAHANCPAKPASKAFAKFGDEASYTLLEGGLFESAAPGWSLGSAEVLSEDPAAQHANYDFGEGDAAASGKSQALLIPDGATVVSPAFCVDSQYPSFRFLVRRAEGPRDATLDISLRWTDAGGTHETSDASIHARRGWALTPVLELASKLPPGVTPNVRLVFQPNGGSFAISAIYIDPYSR